MTSNLAYDYFVRLKFGDYGKEYRVQRLVLCGASKLWRDQLEPDEAYGVVTSLVQPVEDVRVTKPQTVEQFIYWLFWNELPREDNVEQHLNKLTMLHEFAAIYGVRRLHDDTLHFFYQRAMEFLYYPSIAKDEPPVPVTCAYFVWKTVNSGRLGELMEDIFLEGTWKGGRKWYNKQDLADVADEFGIDLVRRAAQRNHLDIRREGQTDKAIKLQAMRFEFAYQEIDGMYEVAK